MDSFEVMIVGSLHGIVAELAMLRECVFALAPDSVKPTLNERIRIIDEQGSQVQKEVQKCLEKLKSSSPRSPEE